MNNLLNYRQYLILEQGSESCPLATKNLELNTRNRDKALDEEGFIKYGPLNLADEEYWKEYAKKWNTQPEVAKQSNCGNCVAFDISPRMEECMPGEVSDPDGKLGYCWMHHFKCHSARTCYTWAAGGPITKDSVSADWQSKNEGELNEKRKTKNSPDWHDSNAPDANGKFKELGIKELAKWLIRTRGGDMRKITGSLNQQIVFNRNNNPAYAKKMESVREEVKRQLSTKNKK
jgi:hypothetical protein